MKKQKTLEKEINFQTQAEADRYFEIIQTKEINRHNKTMKKLEEMQELRMQNIQNQEKEYLKKLSELQIKYKRQKDRISKKHQDYLSAIQETYAYQAKPTVKRMDDDYIDAVAYELKKLIAQDCRGGVFKTQKEKLRTINSEVDALIRQTK